MPGSESFVDGSALAPGLRALVRSSAAQAARDDTGLDQGLREVARAVEEGALTVEGVEEALLQSYLFLGFPSALDALGRWRRLSGAPPPAPTGEDERTWRDRGPEVFLRVYGSQVEAVQANIAHLHPDLSAWMVEEGYGKVLGRGGLALRDRELLVAVLLAVQDAPTQLHSHLRGALRNGVTGAEVEAMLTEVEPWMPAGGALERARATWARVWAAWQARRRAGAGSEPDPGARGSLKEPTTQRTTTRDEGGAGDVH